MEGYWPTITPKPHPISPYSHGKFMYTLERAQHVDCFPQQDMQLVKESFNNDLYRNFNDINNTKKHFEQIKLTKRQKYGKERHKQQK